MLTADQIREKARAFEIDWNSRDPESVAAHYAGFAAAEINDSPRSEGRAALRDLAERMMADFPDMKVRLDDCRPAGQRALFLWTLTGTHKETGNKVELEGWEEWILDDAGEIEQSFSRFDAEEYARQVGEGA